MTDQDANEVVQDEKTYRVKYLEEASWGGGMSKTSTLVTCSNVEVAEGLVRFLDGDGNDVKAMTTDRVISYDVF